ncbi:MAG: hypothetical protein R3E42_04775 [Burkholderiaceae bacterium]
MPPWRFRSCSGLIASFAPGQTIRRGIRDLLRLHRLNTTHLGHGSGVCAWPKRSGPAAFRGIGRRTATPGHPAHHAAPAAFVFADEPTSRLDALTQKETMAALCNAWPTPTAPFWSATTDLARNATVWRFAEGRLHAMG